jgi:hypothetical protein
MKLNNLYSIISLISITVLIIPIVHANPSFSLTDPGTSGIPEAYGSSYLMDPNRDYLRFTYEYVFIRIGNVCWGLPEFNATYVITNSGNSWINQTIAIPGLDYRENSTLRVDDVPITWRYQYYVDMENNWGWDTYACYLFNLTFAPYQSRTINISSPIIFDVYFNTGIKAYPGNLTCRYIVLTGNSWTGGIGEADICVEFDNLYLNEISNFTLKGFTYQNTTHTTRLIYHNESWHPEQDLFVSWVPENWPFNTTVSKSFNNTLVKNETFALELEFEEGLHTVEYLFDWGDGTITNWTTLSYQTHLYTSTGNYTIKIWSKDRFYEIVSDEPITVAVTVEDPVIVVNSNPGYIYLGIIWIIGCVILISGYVVYRKRKP